MLPRRSDHTSEPASLPIDFAVLFIAAPSIDRLRAGTLISRPLPPAYHLLSLGGVLQTCGVGLRRVYPWCKAVGTACSTLPYRRTLPRCEGGREELRRGKPYPVPMPHDPHGRKACRPFSHLTERTNLETSPIIGSCPPQSKPYIPRSSQIPKFPRRPCRAGGEGPTMGCRMGLQPMRHQSRFSRDTRFEIRPGCERPQDGLGAHAALCPFGGAVSAQPVKRLHKRRRGHLRPLHRIDLLPARLADRLSPPKRGLQAFAHNPQCCPD